MYLLKTRFDIAAHQHLGFAHRSGDRFITPGVRAKVIAAQKQLIRLDPSMACHPRDPRRKVGGFHAGISTLLIDLITGSLNQNGQLIFGRETERRLQDVLICGAEARQADTLSVPIAFNKLVDIHALNSQRCFVGLCVL